LANLNAPPRSLTDSWLSRAVFANGWQLSSILIAVVLGIPIFSVLSSIFEPSSDTWQHLSETLLNDYIINSLILAAGVSVGTFLIGVNTAWLTSVCVFPGRRIFEWALLLPMAMPAYIIAYTYTGFLDFAGPIQTTLREAMGWGYGDYWFPDIRSIEGAIVMFSLVLYPYVYLLSRAAFLEQSVCVLEVGRTLGCSIWRSFFTIALPLARPAIIAGVSLAIMETLADYGTVKYFGVDTFTTGIFRTWFGLDDHSAAAQLASMLLGFVFLLVLLERWSRSKAQYHHTTGKYKQLPQYKLAGLRGWIAFAMCLLPLLLGFILPSLQLGQWAWQTHEEMLNSNFITLTLNSLLLAAGASIIALIIALYLGYGTRIYKGIIMSSVQRISSMGYAIPGTVIAIGVIIPFAAIDNHVDSWLRQHWDISSGLLLSGTVFALLFAYTVRFLSVSIQTVEAALGKVRPSMDDAARSLGRKPLQVLREVHLPIMKGSLLTALLLVYVDVLKELPATLILRPFNFNTLAVRAFELASDERLADSASAALMIVAAGIIPVIMLSRSINRSRPGSQRNNDSTT